MICLVSGLLPLSVHVYRESCILGDNTGTDANIQQVFAESGLPGRVETLPTSGKFCRSMALNMGVAR